MASSSRPQDNADNQSIFLCSSASSNETADNLPGSGRIIGNCYSFAGTGLEKLVGDLAERLGFGPRQTAVRIQRRRKVITTYPDLPLLPGPFRAESKKIEEDCRRLLRYVRSSVASTKKQALDRITDLSFEDSYVRGLFKVLGAVDAIEPLQKDPAAWIYYGSSLQNSSRKALVSLADVEINTVLQRADTKIDAYEEEKYTSEDAESLVEDTLREIFAYMYDPDRSFIAIRYFRRLFQKINITSFFVCFADYQALDLIRKPPKDFEWEEADQFLAQLLEYMSTTAVKPSYLYHDDFEHRICDILEMTLRHVNELPRTANSGFLQRWLAYFDEAEIIDDFLEAHRLMYVLLQQIIRTNSVGDGDPDNLYINPGSLQAMYLPVFLLRATCPADIVLCKIAYRRRKFFWTGSRAVLQPAELLGDLCLELARYVDSNDAVLRGRARRCASVLLCTDVYCRAAMMRAFTSTRFAATSDFAEMVKETGSLYRSLPYRSYEYNKLNRCCDANWNLLHIGKGKHCYLGRECAGERKYSLEMSLYDVLELRVPRGTAFSSTDHYPLLAGYTAGGKPAYVASARFKNDSVDSEYCAVIEGTRPEDILITDHVGGKAVKRNGPDFMDVYVLRHAPATYAKDDCYGKTLGDSEEGLDATGPFFWKPMSESGSKHSNSGGDRGIRRIVSECEHPFEIEDWDWTGRIRLDDVDWTMDGPDSDDEDCSMDGSEPSDEDWTMEESESGGEDWRTAEEGSIVTLD
ncbi:hypothetical protein M0805_009686 [Coniferiporia weirii]|nr:hypothetical protein M0805_009686 [Coniferiporia weirii]